MDETERLQLLEDMGSFLRAGVTSIGMKPTCVVRFPGLYQIMDTGVDVVWNNGVSGEDPSWSLKATYAEINMETNEESTGTDILVTCSPDETVAMARAAILFIAENIINDALATTIIKES